MPNSTLFGDFIPQRLPIVKSHKINWFNILQAYKQQDAKDMATMAAMLPAVHSMTKEEYQNLLEITARALVINVTTKQSILIGLVWFIQFCPDQNFAEFLDASCLVGLLRLFINELKKEPEYMLPGSKSTETLAGFTLIAELLLDRKEYDFHFMTSSLKSELKEVRSQIKSNIRDKIYDKQLEPRVKYLDEVLGQLSKEGQEHINFKPGSDKLAHMVLATAGAILGIIVGMAFASTPFGWAVAVTVVGSLALCAGLRQQCRDFYIHYRDIVNEPKHHGIKLEKFQQYRLINNITLLTLSGVNTQDEAGTPLTWKEIVDLLYTVLRQYPDLHQYCASRLIDLVYAYPPATILDSTPLNTFILENIKIHSNQRHIWFQLMCHLHKKNHALFTRGALDEEIAKRKNSSEYEKICDVEFNKIDTMLRDQRLWDVTKLSPQKFAEVKRIQQRWKAFKPENHQLFDTGVLDLLPSHQFRVSEILLEKINYEINSQEKPILLHGPSGCGKTVLAGYYQYHFKDITRLFTFAYQPTSLGQGLSDAMITAHYYGQISKQYQLWARELATEYKLPLMENSLHNPTGVVIEVRRLLGLIGKSWYLIVDGIPKPDYWYGYHQQCGETLLSERNKSYILLTSQHACDNPEAKKAITSIEINPESGREEARRIIDGIHPAKDNVNEQAAVANLIKHTQALPAALAMAAVFIKYQNESGSLGRIKTYAEYWQAINNYSTMLETYIDHKRLMPYTVTTVAIVKFSIGAVDEIAKRDPVDSLMNFLCSIAISPVTYQMIYHHWHTQRPKQKAPIDLHEIIKMAERLNLLRRIKISDMGQDTFAVPKWVHHLWALTLTDDKGVSNLAYLRCLIQSHQEFIDRKKTLSDRFVLPHVTHLLDSCISPPTDGDFEDRIIATYGAADTARVWGNNIEAARLFQKGLQLLEQAQDSQSEQVIRSNAARFYDGLTIVKKLQGEPKQAVEYGEKALKVSAHLPKNELSKGNQYFSLANVYLDTGLFKEARKMFSLALDCRVVAKGMSSGETANSLSGLGLLLSTLNQFSEALYAHDEAIKINEALAQSKASKWCATSYHDKAVCLTTMGNYTEAERLHLKAIDIRTLLLGQDHYQMTTSCNSLGNCYFYWAQSLTHKREGGANEKYKLALELHEQALSNDIIHHGEQHLYTVQSVLYRARTIAAINGKDRLIQTLLDRAKATLDKTELPNTQPHVLYVLWNIVQAVHLKALGNIDGATSVLKNALKLCITIYGEFNLQTAELYWLLSQIATVSDKSQYQSEFNKVIESINDIHTDHWLNHVVW